MEPSLPQPQGVADKGAHSRSISIISAAKGRAPGQPQGASFPQKSRAG